MPSVCIFTLGCPKNTVASRRLETSLRELNFSIIDDSEQADGLIVNTCGFIDPAKEESIDVLLDLGRQKRADQKLIAVGCLAQGYTAELAKAIPEIDAVLNFSRMAELPGVFGMASLLEPGLPAFSGAPSAYLEISEGCDHRCAFCVIPRIRGAYRSRPIEALVAEAEYLAGQGCQEIVLVGQDTGAYGCDLTGRTDLASLVDELSGVDGLKWIRIMYLQWQYLDDRLIRTISGNKKVCSYLDVPLQHASEKIIKSMNRHGAGERYLGVLERIRERLPDVALRTSLIVGYPGETADDFRELAAFVEKAGFDYVGVFEFSKEAGTPAARQKPRVGVKVRRGRAAELRALADEISRRRLSRFLNRTMDILIETRGETESIGRAVFQAPEIDGEVLVSGAVAAGKLVKVHLKMQDNYDFRGKPA